MNLPTCLALCCTYNRHSLLERALRCFIEQDYKGKHIMLIWNTGEATTLDKLDLPSNKEVVLVNSDKEYSSVGEKFLTAFQYADINFPEVEYIYLADDDDMYMPYFISDCIEGLQKSGKKAYKAKLSYFCQPANTQRCENVFETSIMVNKEFMKNHPFIDETVKYSDGWVKPLIEQDEIFVDPEAKSGMLYGWGIDNIYKLSGGSNDTLNFQRSQVFQGDKGDGIITPWSKKKLEDLFKNIFEDLIES
jgi:glycosyl transferase family 2